jgi:hypothetical protein
LIAHLDFLPSTGTARRHVNRFRFGIQ